MKKIFFVFTIFYCFLIFPVAGQSVFINEVVASNKTGLKDDDGQYSDWIELYNNTGLSVSLKGWSITDDRTNPTKWIFPDVDILPRSYFVVFASENDRATNKNYLHTNFKLNEKGEYLAVFDNNCKKISEVAPFPLLSENQSAGLFGGRWSVFKNPTPGASIKTVYDEIKINLANYPNPFSINTTIEYNIKSFCNIDLSVFDLTGRKIDALVNGNHQPGSYRFVYDTSKLVPGTYICRITLNVEVSTGGIVRMIKL